MAAAQGGESHAYEQTAPGVGQLAAALLTRGGFPGAAAEDARQGRAFSPSMPGRHAYAPSRPFGPWVPRRSPDTNGSTTFEGPPGSQP